VQINNAIDMNCEKAVMVTDTSRHKYLLYFISTNSLSPPLFTEVLYEAMKVSGHVCV